MDKHNWVKVEGGWKDEEGNFISEAEVEAREEAELDSNEELED